MTDDTLAGRYGLNENDIVYDQRDGTEIVIIIFNGTKQQQEALDTTPELRASVYQGVQAMETKPQQGRTVKIRHCPIETSAKKLIMINNFKKWNGSSAGPKKGNKTTLAILNAPTEKEADTLKRGT